MARGGDDGIDDTVEAGAAPRRRCAAGDHRRRSAVLLDHPDRFIRRRHISDIGNPHQHHFGRRRGPGRGLHLGDALEQHLPHPRQHPHRKLCSKLARAHPFGLAEGDIVRGGRHDFYAGDEVDEFGEVGQHHDRIGADVILFAKFLERARNIAARQRIEQVDHPGAVGEAEHLAHRIGAHEACRMRDRLIEQRQRIAHRAFRRTRDDAERFGLDLDILFRGDIGKMLHQHVGLDPAQIEPLAARQHRDRDFSDFGGGEDEFGVLRRLFQRLEERVEGRGREHVDFVDDVDLVARARRRIAHAVVDLAHVVDTGMGGGVHFQHVHVPAFHDGPAMHAQNRHVDGRPFHRSVRQFVIQGAGQNPRRGGLADPAHPGQDPGLRNSSGFERIRNGADHGLLADQIVKAGRAVFARQHPIGFAGLGDLGRRAADIEAALVGAVRLIGGSASVVHRSIRKWLSLTAGLRKGVESGAKRGAGRS